jgi:metallo-beta-lactamase family protein
MKITLYGAAGNVTGSAYYVQTQFARILVDFGIFQGGKEADTLNRNFPPVELAKLDAVVLTHAHLDHTGRLPLLAQKGYRNPVYCTPATIDMTTLILHDSVKVQTLDMERTNRRRTRQGKSLLSTFYSKQDVEHILALLKPIPYSENVNIAKGLSIRAVEAGHILGSVSIEVTVEEEGRKKIVIFSGDLGPQGMAILKDPVPFTTADLVLMESTYGDRDHRSLKETLVEGEAIIRHAVQYKGKILIPAFAVGRTQQLLYYLAAAIHKGNVPHFPVFIDSPMAIEATDIYRKHPELYDEEAMEMLNSGELKEDFSHLQYSTTADESKALNFVPGPCMILAGAGMCNAGRILHHLRHNLWKPETSVIIVGYQAQGTLGRRLVEGEKQVTIFGEKVAVKAHIHLLGGLSAHAGQSDLLRWFDAVSGAKPRLVLSHGEDRGRKPLAEIIAKRYGINAVLPEFGDVIEI